MRSGVSRVHPSGCPGPVADSRPAARAGLARWPSATTPSRSRDLAPPVGAHVLGRAAPMRPRRTAHPATRPAATPGVIRRRRPDPGRPCSTEPWSGRRRRDHPPVLERPVAAFRRDREGGPVAPGRPREICPIGRSGDSHRHLGSAQNSWSRRTGLRRARRPARSRPQAETSGGPDPDIEWPRWSHRMVRRKARPRAPRAGPFPPSVRAPGRDRTDTGTLLRGLPLPIGLRGRPAHASCGGPARRTDARCRVPPVEPR